jgi:MoxR-like ATPase
MTFPTSEREAEILRSRVPEVDAKLANQIVRFVAQLRELDLKKDPSISESIDWARALVVLSAETLGEDVVSNTLNLLLKYEGDLETARAKLPALIKAAVAAD